ncbi:hypothetical protein BDQ17DRAFT_1513410 [Cyathus striatus]|nr:hypothetical protein BDQ17DRAFT_1513410 [Cyathus striatus]
MPCLASARLVSSLCAVLAPHCVLPLPSLKLHCHTNLLPTTINDVLRLEERRRVFNVGGLRRLAAESVSRRRFNRTFLITMRDGFQMVARIPYLATTPKYFSVASEVATMDLLRSSGLPIPKVYGYSPTPDNAAETEYIFMDFFMVDLEEQDIKTILYQVVELESKMTSIAFPAAEACTNKRLGTGILLEDERFSVGPDVRIPMCPVTSVAFQRIRREAYRYQEQLPSDHIENLNRYRLIAPSLIPQNLNLSHFRIRHPDLRQAISFLIDCNMPRSYPMFVLAGIPDQSMEHPSLPEDYDDLDESRQSREQGLYHRRLCLWEAESLSLKVALIDAIEKWEKLTQGGAPCPFEGWVPVQNYEEAMVRNKEMKESALAAGRVGEGSADIATFWPWDDMDETEYL